MNGENQFEFSWEGIPLKVKCNKLAQQANGSCLVQYGDTVVLASVVMDSMSESKLNFFPLNVEYEEKMYAAGKIKGSRFIKRETRPTDEAVLTARLIDRSIRPLFDKNFKRPVQVVLTVLSIDQENDPDVVSLLAGSIALSISDVPWQGLIAGVRICKSEDKWFVNPTVKEKETAEFDLFVAGNKDKVIMIEMGGKEALEDDVLEGTKMAKKSLAEVLGFVQTIKDKIGKDKIDFKEEFSEEEIAFRNKVQETEKQIDELVNLKINQYLLDDAKPTKALRKKTLKEMNKEFKTYLLSEGIDEDIVNEAMESFIEKVEEKVSAALLDKGYRVDGRAIDEIRPLGALVNLLPRTHGSAVFDRGETQVMSIVTLGSPGDEQILDTMEQQGTKRYMHHYNFPGYSVGEVKPNRGASRRDIGHGSLAEKALQPMIPDKEEFPYTIRVVSEVLGSNGSSSMASVCGSSLALMDAGVPIKSPVAGIAMGLASDGSGRYRVFTDLQDLEDSNGGMDFKVAGTKDGITAIQLDTKTDGLSDDIIKETLEMAKKARLRILDIMLSEIKEPRKELSKYAPRIETITIDPEKIKDVIGPGGKVVKEIIEKTGVQIDIEQDGNVFITSVDQNGMQEAIAIIKEITKVIEVGEIYEAKVVSITDFGAFVALNEYQDALLHVSEIKHQRVNKVTDVLKIGDTVKVKVMEVDSQGKIGVSAKALLPRENRDNRDGRENGFNKPNKGFRRNNRNFKDNGNRKPRC